MKTFRWGRLFGNAGLLLVALITWAFAGQPGYSTLATGSLFLASCAALLVVMRRHLWAALAVIGFMALTMNPSALDALDPWGVAFMVCTATGLAMSLRRWRGGRWIASSVPFWAMAEAAPWAMYIALGLVFAGMAIAGVGPTLPGRRIRGADALPHMASGALVPVESRVYPAARPSRVIRVLTYGFAGLTVILGVMAGGGFNADITAALATAAAIIAVTFAFSNWFSGRLQLRIDERGLHSRLFYREHSIAWTEVASLSLRYVFLPGMGVRVVYYCVRSPRREFAFPSSMKGAAELQASIEAATGLSWPVPEITPTI